MVDASKEQLVKYLFLLIYYIFHGGGGGIRTHGRLSPTLVFKTRALNHSATLPVGAPCRTRTGTPEGKGF